VTDTKSPRPLGGRPPIDPRDLPSVDVHVSLPATVYDRAYAIARAKEVSVPEVLRRAFLQTLGEKVR
jgi:hypothetical protein